MQVTIKNEKHWEETLKHGWLDATLDESGLSILGKIRDKRGLQTFIQKLRTFIDAVEKDLKEEK